VKKIKLVYAIKVKLLINNEVYLISLLKIHGIIMMWNKIHLEKFKIQLMLRKLSCKAKMMLVKIYPMKV
jgi:hypothetical protein